MALQVNGEYVDDSVIRAEAAAMRPRYDEMMADMDPVEREVQLREWSRENVIERVLLRQEAAKDETPVPKEEVDERLTAMFPPAGDLENCEAGATRAGVDREEAAREIEVQIKLERLIRKVSERAGKPKHKDVVDFYKKNKEQFATPPMVLASHVVKNVGEGEDENAALEEIKKAEAELNEGAPFAEVADKYSDCAGQGGTLGWFPMGEMVEEFEKEAFPLEPGQRTPIFRSVFGWHIATVHDKRPEGIQPLDDVKSQIEAHLAREKQEKALEDFVDRLRAKADVQNVKRRQPPPGAPAEEATAEEENEVQA
jgi:peptidyl-prolyl cis-trans isomerase C